MSKSDSCIHLPTFTKEGNRRGEFIALRIGNRHVNKKLYRLTFVAVVTRNNLPKHEPVSFPPVVNPGTIRSTALAYMGPRLCSEQREYKCSYELDLGHTLKQRQERFIFLCLLKVRERRRFYYLCRSSR